MSTNSKLSTTAQYLLSCAELSILKLSLSIFKHNPSAPSPLHLSSLVLPFPALSSELLIAMVAKRGGKILVISFLLTVLASQSLVECRNLEKEEAADQKTYYSPLDPHAGTPPSHGGSPPRYHRTPSCPPPPHHRGSGCGCDPYHGGSPGTTTPPSHGGGGYYSSPPPSPTVGPISPLPPSIPLGPPTPITIPPSPTTPILTPPSPPYIPVDPNNPGGTPGTPIYWSTNPTLIWGIFGYWATIGGLFGPITTMPFGTNLSVQQALANTRTDGFGALYREGMASYLNSVINRNFPFSTPQVRHAFASSLVSEKAAANQARVFKLANEGRLKKH